MIRTIVFDFDGVIVRNSEFGKDRGWEEIFPEQVMEDVILVKKKYSGGLGSRVDIIRDIANILHIKPEKVDSWIDRKVKEFGDFTSTFTINDGITLKDKEAIETLAFKYPLYINSATPESSLFEIVRILKIDSYFKGIYGQYNSNSKIKNLEKIKKDTGLQSEEILFVGDQDTDFFSSKEFGCYFVGIMNDYNNWKNNKVFPLIKGIYELPKFLIDFQ